LIIGLIGAYQIIFALIDGFVAVCIAREDMHLAGSLDFAFKAITAMVGIIVVMAGSDLVMVMIVFPIVAVVLLFIIFRVVTKKYGHIKLSFSWSYLTRKLREAIPFGLLDLLISAMLRYFAWLLLLAFLKSFMEILLTSCNRQAEGTRSQWTAICVNIVGNV
jgi:hypothetical protein